ALLSIAHIRRFATALVAGATAGAFCLGARYSAVGGLHGPWLPQRRVRGSHRRRHRRSTPRRDRALSDPAALATWCVVWCGLLPHRDSRVSAAAAARVCALRARVPRLRTGLRS